MSITKHWHVDVFRPILYYQTYEIWVQIEHGMFELV